MKTLVFDTSSLISLSNSCLLWTLRTLKKEFDVRFAIPPAVKIESVDNALRNYRWGLGGERIKGLISDGIIEVRNPPELRRITDEILEECNNAFSAKGRPIKIIHDGEAQAIALCNILDAETLVVDEKTTRLMVEKPENVQQNLQSKLHTEVSMDSEKCRKVRKLFPNLKVIRSTEIVAIAHEEKILSRICEKCGGKNGNIFKMCLWSLRFGGCSISSQEIKDYVNMMR